MAAVTVPEAMYQALIDRKPQDRHLRPRLHLFGGHPVAAAVALKTLEIYAARANPGSGCTQIAAVPGAPRCAWRASAGRRGARLGAGRGVELAADKATKRPFEPKAGVGPRTVQFAEEEGLIVRFLAGDVISICPPLVISAEEIDLLFDRLGSALDRTLDWAKQQRLV